MFDTIRVGRKIKELRQKKDITQMELADKMGVSYQAVSNWERGNSMPDISKLSELTEILECSIDELLGKSKETDFVKTAVKDGIDEVQEKIPEIDTLVKISPILKPKQTESILEKILKSNPQIEIREITAIAPFLSDEFLNDLVEKVDVVNNIEDIISLAPFLSDTTLKNIVLKLDNVESLNKLMGLAPFLNDECLDYLVMKALNEGNIEECKGLYPFLSEKTLHKLADELVKHYGINAIKGLAPFL